PRRHLVLQEFIHGPFRYPSGGDKSHQALDLLAALKCQFPERVHFLPGNHELAQWTGEWIGKGDDDLNEEFRRGGEWASGGPREAVGAAYRGLLAVVPLGVRTPNRVFLSHSLPSAARLPQFDPAVLEQQECADEELRPGGSVYSLVWGRDVSAANA